MAVAQDSEGEAAAGRFYDRAGASYTTLIDTQHLVSSLYQMVNVPMGVWIDEQGTVVRPPEVAYTTEVKVMGQQIGDRRYVVGLRDWIANGDKSRYLMPQERLVERLSLRSADEQLAAAHFRLGSHLHQAGQERAARRHWRKAQQLDPDNWNYHRQEWSFSAADAILKFGNKIRKLGGKPYYEPLDMPDE